MSDLVRLSVNLNWPTADALNQLADDLQLSRTEIIRRAISVYRFVNSETDAGNHFYTRDKKGWEREVIFR